jgi:serine/threonine protein kinase
VVLRATFFSLASAVARVHGQGVAHLDLKPPNFVATSSSTSASKLNLAQSFALIDFGCARKVKAEGEEGKMMEENMPGTLNCQFGWSTHRARERCAIACADSCFRARRCVVCPVSDMAPEFFLSSCSSSGESAGSFLVPSFPADIWALGVILYQLVYSNRTPFGHIDKEEERRKILSIVHSTVEAPPAAKQAGMPSATNHYHIAFPNTALASPTAIDLMKACLANAPEKRPTIQQVLAHPFLTLATPPPPTPQPTALPPGSFIVTADQIHALIGLLANSTFSASKLKEHEVNFLKKLKTQL